MKIRKCKENDLDKIVKINRLFEDQIFIRDRDDFKKLLEDCEIYVAESEDKKIVGYLTFINDSSDYSEETLNWFRERFSHFLYVQQIAVDKTYQGKGIGSSLYKYLIKHANSVYSSIFCDLFIQPKNIQSHNFHTKLGFKQIDSLTLKDGRILGMFELKRS